MSEEVLGLKEAARRLGVSVNTIKRHRETLAAAGATIDARGWRIPVSALVETGLLDSVRGVNADTSTDTQDRTPRTPPVDTPDFQQEVQRLRTERDAARTEAREAVDAMKDARRDQAIAEAEARAAQQVAQSHMVTIQAQQTAIRELEAARDREPITARVDTPRTPPERVSVTPRTPPVDTATDAPRRGLFDRLRRR